MPKAVWDNLKDHLGSVRVAIGDMKTPSGNSFVVDEKSVCDYSI
ncbi:MAG: hypothetical protein NTW25_06495 [Candidatus Kapabacteria bacterium]|nr:hypothetical protein [Candidatus Kapabacteria bacterium]